MLTDIDGNRIENRTIGAARLEVQDIMGILTPLQRRRYRQRILDGMIDGDFYMRFEDEDDPYRPSCGCAYGTIMAVKPFRMKSKPMSIVGPLLRSLLPRFKTHRSSSVAYEHLTPLEKIIKSVHEGDTPGINPNLKWLLDQVDTYITSHP